MNAAREERYRRLRTPSMVDPETDPETVPSWVAWALMCALSLLFLAAAIGYVVVLPTLRGWLA